MFCYNIYTQRRVKAKLNIPFEIYLLILLYIIEFLKIYFISKKRRREKCITNKKFYALGSIYLYQKNKKMETNY